MCLLWQTLLWAPPLLYGSGATPLSRRDPGQKQVPLSGDTVSSFLALLACCHFSKRSSPLEKSKPTLHLLKPCLSNLT